MAMRFTLHGVVHDLSKADVERRLTGVAPEPVRQHGVRVNEVVYPVKQALEVVAGVPRSEFTSHIARRQLAALGFEVVGAIVPRGPQEAPSAPLAPSGVEDGGSPYPHASADEPAPTAEHWHTEARVQAAVVAHLAAQGWRILSVADTASRQHGIDVVAAHPDGGRTGVGIEVKGYPSRHYADPARAGEAKRTQPSTQAGHWYGQAVLAAMRLPHSRPELRSVIALPGSRGTRTCSRKPEPPWTPPASRCGGSPKPAP